MDRISLWRSLVVATTCAGLAVGCGTGAVLGDGASDAPVDARSDGAAHEGGVVDSGGMDVVALDADATVGDADATIGDADAGFVDADASLADADAGSASAAVTPTMLDFGAADCGGTASAAQTVTAQNTGTAPLTVTAALASGAAFAITGSATLTVAPGTSGTITVTPLAVPSTATAGTALTDTLTLTTNDPDHGAITVPLSVTPRGATLTLTPTGAAFGPTPLTHAAAAIPLTVTNAGTVPVTLTFGAPADPQFSLAYTGSPAAVVLAPGASVPGLAAGFTPTRTSMTSTSAALTVSGAATCGASVTSIPLTGQGTVGAVTLSASRLDFGSNPCGGAAAPAQTLTIGNSGTAAYTITGLSLGRGATSPYATAASGMTVPPGGSVTVTVTPSAIPSVSSVPGSYGDTLTVATDIPGDSPHLVALAEAAQGAILAYDTSNIAFGGVAVSTTQTASFGVVNHGNAPATVTLGTTNAVFGVTPSSAFALPGSDTVQLGSAAFSPADTSTQTGTLQMAVGATDVLCQPLPTPIALSGTGQNGGVGLSTSAISFGNVACGTTAAAQSFTLTNTGNAPLTWNAAVGRTPGPFTISPTTGTLAPAAIATITVTPSEIPATSSVADDYYADTITITSDAAMDAPHSIALHETALGAILGFNPTAVAFGSVPDGTTSSAGYQLVNSGNASATLTVASSDPTFGVAASAITVPASGTTTSTVTFTPGTTDTTTHMATATLASSGPLCAPLPTPLALSATGSRGVVAFSPSSLSFGSVNCGTAGTAQQITFSNPGTLNYTLTSEVLTRGSSSPFTVAMSPASGVVTPGGSLTVTVTPRAIPFPSAVPGNYSDTLTVTTNAIGDAPHPIALSMGAQGVILALSNTSINFGTVNIGATGVYEISVTNSGNVATTVGFAPANPAFTFDQGQTVAAGAPIQPNAYFTPLAAMTYASNSTVTVPAGTVLCQALPGPIALAGVGGTGSTTQISPTSLTFGNVACGGAAAPPQTVTVTNRANVPVSFTASVSSTRYSLSSTGGTLAAMGGAIGIVVTPAPITVSASTSTASNAYGDTLVITVGSSSFNVPLYETALGAVLQWDRGVVLVGHGSATNFTVRNVGDAPGTVLFTTNNTHLTMAPTHVTVNFGGGNNAAGVGVIDSATGATSGIITMTIDPAFDTPICQPLPDPLPVTGT